MSLNQIVNLESESAETSFNRGVNFMENGQYAESETCFRRTLVLAPESQETRLNLGYVLDKQGRSAEAFACYESVLAVDPNNAKARYNRAIHLLRAGDMIAGFADYEARFAAIRNADSRVYTQPRWDGSPLNGRSVLIYGEQGLGDAIQFSRYIPQLARLGGRVLLEVQQPLLTLLSRLPGVDRVVLKSDTPPITDCHIPLLSLPYLFGTDLATVPASIPYLFPDPSKTTAWRGVLARDPLFKIGLVWRGSASNPMDSDRSCPFAELIPLLAITRASFYSLQVGSVVSRPSDIAESAGLIDMTNHLHDFSDTAALIANLDLVITVDTAVAHLAGAMGKPTWILLGHTPDWRWMLERSDSPWYPDVRLFRQPVPGDWCSVVREVFQALQHKLSKQNCNATILIETLEASFQQALAAIENSDPETAIRELKSLLLQLPEESPIWFNLGRAYDMAEHFSEAADAYRQALSGSPSSPAIWFALGGIRLKQKAYPEAEFCLSKAHMLNPESVEILLSLGSALSAQHKTNEAFDCCKKIVAIKPDCVEAIYNMAFIQLRRGEYLPGFANFEARLTIEKFDIDPRRYLQPRWDGTPLNGKSILIYGEQGMGDVIQFSRYIPLVAELGGKVVFEVDLPLVPLFESLPGAEQVLPKSQQPPFTDVYIQLLSLPYLFGTTLETVPNQVPYILPDQIKVEKWRRSLASHGPAYRIGLVWRGNPLNPHDQIRSCPLVEFLPLADFDGVQLFSLQVGAGVDEISSEVSGLKLIDYTGQLRDFSDTAAFIANLDLVIGVDTAVTHLAGALGRNVWVILPQVYDWRWLEGQDNSPWYPTGRVFWQHHQGDWTGVINRLKNSLTECLAEKGLIDIESGYEKGSRLKAAGDLAGAERCFRQIVEQCPDLPDPQHSLGVVLQMQGRAAEAIEHYKAAIVQDPGFVQALYNLANALVQSGRSHEALEYVHAVLRYDAAHADAHWMLGMLLLLHEEYLEGWKEYEWRWQAKQFLAKIPDPGRPQWDGSPLAGRTLLIQMEQGRGDMIQFARYIPLAAAMGGKVIVRAVPELLSLLSTADGVSMVVDQNLPLPDFDLYIPVMSLPYVFGTTIETIPSLIPFLRPDQCKVEEWRREMPVDGLLRIGLAWQGASENRDNQKRSCPLVALQPLFELEGVDFYSLQIGEGSEQLKELPATMQIVDLTDRIHDFADTAALIENLDLVISVCTSVTHLAGALGKPVWTMLHFASDWRWHLERSDSPWYPTMKLFRQTVQDDWSGVIAGVKNELTQLLSDTKFYNKRGISMLLAGDFPRAEQAFSRAITLDQGCAEAFCNRGAALDALNRLDEAIVSYQTALKLRPDYMQALYNLGNTYMSLRKPAEALSCYERVIELNPDFVAAYLSLGEVGKTLPDFALGRAGFEQAAAIDPGCAEAFQGIGDICQAEERFDDAIVAYKKALELKPGNIATLNMMGAAYQSIERLMEAEDCYRQALLQAPEQAAVLNNLAVVLNAQGRLEEAIAVYHQLLEVTPDYADGHWNLSVALLALGEYKEGWREFEWRFKKANPVPLRPFLQPVWDGSSLSGKTILLHAEQGFGDTIQFVRYVHLLSRQGGRVIIECQVPALKRLLSSLDGVVDVVIAGQPLPHFDCHLPLMSLPLIFNTTLETIPGRVPYLFADQQDVDLWRQRLRTSGRLKVGLVWYAKQSQVLNRKRSCPLSFFTTLWKVDHVDFYSLQVGVGTEQLQGFAAGHSIIDLAGDIDDFADTAAIIANLDLVITIDTAVAHLAGALGVKTWVILPHIAEWRWLRQRTDSPWYPSMTLFRQPVQGDWPALMDNVAAALQDCVDSSNENMLSKSACHKLRVGLAWSGRQDNPVNRKRSCPFSALKPLFDLENIVFVRLQLDSTEDSDLRMVDFTAHIQSFEDTAALMADLDLIISIDTSVAHLAAATGRPTWVLLSHVADWRWSSPDGKWSTWYPCVELFRQPDFGDWDTVISVVADRLSRLSGANAVQISGASGRTLHVSLERQELELLLKDNLNEVQCDVASADAHLNVGAALALLGRHAEAISRFQHVLELDPEHVAGHLNLAYSLLALERFSEGWDHFEWRQRRVSSDQLPPWPMLDKNNFGTHPVGTRLLVHCEQGYGDTIQFCRFLSPLIEKGYCVVVSCQPPMTALINSITGVCKVVPHGDSLPVCDFQALLLSLPGLFLTTKDSLPLKIPYIAPDKAALEKWEKIINKKNTLFF